MFDITEENTSLLEYRKSFSRENAWDSDTDAVNYALPEKENPVFSTAKITLFQLAANGGKDAGVPAKSMGLPTEETQNSAAARALPKQVTDDTVMMKIRCGTIARPAEKPGCTSADLPCGYLPRALESAKNDLFHYGPALPAMIQDAAGVTRSLWLPF